MSILREPVWLEYGKTNYVTGDNDPIHGIYGTINKTPRTLWEHQQPINREIDTVEYVYTDAATITLQAGGVFGSEDGSVLYVIDNNTAIMLSDDLSADATGAPSVQNSTFYYIYGGEDGTGALAFYVSDVSDTLPSELVKGRRLHDGLCVDVAGDIQKFYFFGREYMYDCAALCAGADAMEVYDATTFTTWQTVDLGHTVPSGSVLVHLVICVQTHLWTRLVGDTHAGVLQHQQLQNSFRDVVHRYIPVVDGQFQILNNAVFGGNQYTIIGFIQNRIL